MWKTANPQARGGAGQGTRGATRPARRRLWSPDRVRENWSRGPAAKQMPVQFDSVETRFVLENDPDQIPLVVSRLEDLAQRKLAEPDRLPLLGIALHEAITNALMHGNLELSSDLRETNEQEYYRLAQERRA